MIQTFGAENFQLLCDRIAGSDPELRQVIARYGYPPLWSRPAGFQTLVHIILEQQVSLASAQAALDKLKGKIGTVTPEKILLLSEAELKTCYFSRQKANYVKLLAGAIHSGKIVLEQFCYRPDDRIRKQLKEIKGIGDWTADIYLLMALQRTDIFPIGDLAMVSSLKKLKHLPVKTSPTTLLEMASGWRPYRSIATMILWHHYLEERKISRKQ